MTSSGSPIRLVEWSLVALTSGLAIVGFTGPAVVGALAEIVGLAGTGFAALSIARTQRSRAPERARAWSIVAWGLVLFGLGVSPYFVWPEPTPVHSATELIGIPFLFVGLGQLRRSLRVPPDALRLAGLDGFLAGTAGVVVTWMVAFEPFVGRHPMSSLLALGIFPLAAILVLSYWILPLYLLDRHNPVARSLVFITLSVAAVSLVVAVADISSEIDVRRLHGLYGIVAALGAVTIADARCWSEEELSVDSAFLDPDRVALICASLAVIPVLLVASAVVGAVPHLLVPGGGAGVMVLIVTIRLRRALRDADLLQSRLRHLAEIDPLTGLANRRAVEDRLATLESSAAEIAIMFIDLDRFKLINDGYGHEVGDLLLCEVADRLRRATRDGDFVGRFGGDEFVVLAPGLPARQAEATARRIQRLLIDNYEIAAESLTIGASVGLACRSDPAESSVTQLLELAGRQGDVPIESSRERTSYRHGSSRRPRPDLPSFWPESDISVIMQHLTNFPGTDDTQAS